MYSHRVIHVLAIIHIFVSSSFSLYCITPMMMKLCTLCTLGIHLLMGKVVFVCFVLFWFTSRRCKDLNACLCAKFEIYNYDTVGKKETPVLD